jgi:predicted Ser/Thr protein kinase
MSPDEPAPLGNAGRLPRGATLGRYVVLDPIGAGGMGVVYAAYDFGLDRKVALKLVRGDVSPAARDERRMRLLEEAQAVARLTHPNVIAVHDVGSWQEEIFIAMEYVEGATLDQWLASTPRPTLRHVLDVFLQAGRGLAAAHRAGLIHRDFKPQNVLVGADGRVRVTDFGLARRMPDADGAVPSGTHGSGTPAYMAPEQAAGHGGSALADQYSFAVALHEAVYGQRPPLTAPAGVRVPSWLRKVLLRALSADPARRYPSVDALLSELNRGGRAARAAGAVLVPAAAAATVALAFWPRPIAERPEPAPLAATTEAACVPGETVLFPVPVLAFAPTPAAPPASQTSLVSRHGPHAPAAVVASPAWAPPATSHPPASRPAPPSPTATAPSPHEDPLFLALQRLARALRDLGLIDEQMALKHPVVARLLAPDSGPDLEVVAWAPVAWTAASTPPPPPLFTTFTIPDRPRTLEDALAQAADPVEAAEVKFSYAQAIWERDRDRALRLAQEAQQALLTTQDSPPELLERVRSWIEGKINAPP